MQMLSSFQCKSAVLLTVMSSYISMYNRTLSDEELIDVREKVGNYLTLTAKATISRARTSREQSK